MVARLVMTFDRFDGRIIFSPPPLRVSFQGNWVADEVLFQARIHPETAASALSKEELELLRQAIVDVCDFAVRVGADDKQFPSDWLFHSRWHKAGGVVLGHPVSYITVNGRTSAFVAALQKKKAGAICFLPGVPVGIPARPAVICPRLA
jgi:formamidopyrimidine-DNA glycosylase